MTAIINYKICDNAKECGGIAVCPNSAIYYDEIKKTIVVDKNKCTSCGLCINECPVGAILVAKTDEEYQKLQNEIENDPRTIKDLFVDRYGATTLSKFFIIDENSLQDKIENDVLTLIEIYNDNSIQCLLKSIPIKEIINKVDQKVFFYKLHPTSTTIEKYNITSFPSLLLFKSGELLGKVEGYYNINQIEVFLQKIVEILKQTS